MTQINYNCFVCAQECSYDELHSSASLQNINITNYKICKECLNLANPDDDYDEVKKIVNSYLEFSEIKNTLKNKKIAEKLKDIL
jgi:hypothetical protein